MYPSRANIIESVNYPALIKDNVLRDGCVLLKTAGGPKCWSGGFSLVFQIDTNGQLWAFKVWHVLLDKMEERYAKIKKCLDASNLPYFTEFDYIPKGLFVENTFVPTHRMKWVQGITLDEYIDIHIHQQDKLIALAAKFLVMTREFHAEGIAHGDLQHGNILVKPDETLAVIDYDSMFVQGLNDLPDIIKGLGGYQHPSRLNNEFIHTQLDNFSEIVIYLSLIVYADRPELWNKNTDWLLFSKEDLENPDECELLKQLINSSNKLIAYLSKILTQLLQLRELHELPSLELVLASNSQIKKPSITSITNKF